MDSADAKALTEMISLLPGIKKGADNELPVSINQIYLLENLFGSILNTYCKFGLLVEWFSGIMVKMQAEKLLEGHKPGTWVLYAEMDTKKRSGTFHTPEGTNATTKVCFVNKKGHTEHLQVVKEPVWEKFYIRESGVIHDFVDTLIMSHPSLKFPYKKSLVTTEDQVDQFWQKHFSNEASKISITWEDVGVGWDAFVQALQAETKQISKQTARSLKFVFSSIQAAKQKYLNNRSLETSRKRSNTRSKVTEYKELDPNHVQVSKADLFLYEQLFGDIFKVYDDHIILNQWYVGAYSLKQAEVLLSTSKVNSFVFRLEIFEDSEVPGHLSHLPAGKAVSLVVSHKETPKVIKHHYIIKNDGNKTFFSSDAPKEEYSSLINLITKKSNKWINPVQFTTSAYNIWLLESLLKEEKEQEEKK